MNNDRRAPQSLEQSGQYIGWSLKSIDESLKRIADALQHQKIDKEISNSMKGRDFFDVNSLDR